MRTGSRAGRLAIGGGVVGVIVLLAAPGQAAATPQVRFLHAVAGAGPARLVVPKHPPLLRSSFGKPSAYQRCSPGPARLLLKVRGRSAPVARGRATIGDGRYTVVAVAEGKGIALRVYEDDGVKPGMATLRAIHAAAEIDRADVRVDGRVVAPALRRGAATEYASLEPGRHDLSVTRPGGRGGALLSKAGVPLTAGTSSTAIVVGSRGEPARLLLVSDATAGPSAAPATGFLGDDGDGEAWFLVVGAALGAGALGGAMYVLTARLKAATALATSRPPSRPAPVAAASMEAVRPVDAPGWSAAASPPVGAPAEPSLDQRTPVEPEEASPSPEPAPRDGAAYDETERRRAARGTPREPSSPREIAPRREGRWVVALGATVVAGSLGRAAYGLAARRRRGL